MSTKESVIKRLEKWNNLPEATINEVVITLKINNKIINVSNKITCQELIKINQFKKKQEILALKFNDIMSDLFSSLSEYLQEGILYNVVPIYFDNPEGKEIFWHSSAHILGSALETIYEVSLLTGPPVAEGFYYDAYFKEIIDVDIDIITNEMNKVISMAYPFERKRISLSLAKDLFIDNPYKQEILNVIEPNKLITVYKCGDFIDLCKGPHLINTKIINIAKVLNCTNTHNINIKRIKAISFPTNIALDLFQKEQTRRLNYSHQIIGTKQELFFFNELSPGCCFFLPHGTRMINTMINVMREFYYDKGFQEVITPNIVKGKLYEISGHKENYKDNMYCFDCESEEMYLKPMNCPGHCLMFGHKSRSYNELPIRFADFGVLHRNELSGTLSGLTRVRRFCQDDAHIFCSREQIKNEINNAIYFVREVYNLFGFKFSVELSTRPDKYEGNLDLWSFAENVLQEILTEAFNNEWKINEKDGAFYGPKLDFFVLDKFNRRHQCATIQLDFVLSEKFKLEYVNDNNETLRPVIIHRAIYGSLERFFALVIENYEGVYPLWLSPRQVIIIPVNKGCNSYAHEIYAKLREKRIFVDINMTDNTLNKKIGMASKLENKYNYVIVVGDMEVKSRTVSVRDINANKFTWTLDEFVNRVIGEIREKK